jgi:hypothetical protein
MAVNSSIVPIADRNSPVRPLTVLTNRHSGQTVEATRKSPVSKENPLLPLDPDQIASSREPDVVWFSEWVPDPDEKPEDRPRRKELVAVAWSLFKVTRYEERVFETVRERRSKFESWKVPAMRVPVLLGPPTVKVEPDHTVSDLSYVIYDLRPSTVGRRSDEYRSRERQVFDLEVRA